jgi:hypothetical protein
MATAYPFVRQPAVGPEAFRVTTGETAQSQAAVLLAIGRQLRGDDAALRAAVKSAGPSGVLRGPVLGVSARSFPVPDVGEAADRVDAKSCRSEARRRYAVGRSAPGGAKWERGVAACAAELFEAPGVDRAAQLLELCLDHPVPLVRIAAAAAYYPVTTEPERAIGLLADGAASRDDLERDVAASALARIQPEHRALAKLTRLRPPGRGGRKSHTASIIHGTWAANGSWWRPGGDFYDYVETFRPDLYGAADRFRWTGGYSDGARDLAGQELKAWVEARGLAGIDLFCHSHGASAAMLATQLGMSVGTLVMLSCPAHPHKYFPNFANVNRVVSVRVKLDLVILVDGGGQKFSHPQIEENVLPVWFNHSATHDPEVWQDHGVQALV